MSEPSVDINAKVEEYRHHPEAVLLDVREDVEYQSGHIPGALSQPLSRIDQIEGTVPDQNTKIYVYCHSGKRAEEAVYYMHAMGYTNLENIGGIKDYTGEIEK